MNQNAKFFGNLATKAANNTKVKKILLENTILDLTNTTSKDNLDTKAAEIQNEIVDTTGFSSTLEFNRLMEMNFDAIMIKGSKTW